MRPVAHSGDYRHGRKLLITVAVVEVILADVVSPACNSEQARQPLIAGEYEQDDCHDGNEPCNLRDCSEYWLANQESNSAKSDTDCGEARGVRVERGH